MNGQARGKLINTFVRMKTKVLMFMMALTAASCSTDFDINAPYKDYSIVFGLLNQNDSIHYIKVNKAFLGTGNASDYAAIRDSSEYASVSGEVQAWNGSTLVNTYQLLDTELVNRDSGLFYYPMQTMYYFIEPNLNSSYEYKLSVLVNEGSKEINGTTNLVAPFSYNGPLILPFGSFNFVTITSTGVTYPEYKFEIISGLNARRFDTWLIINVEEYLQSGSMNPVKLLWKQNAYVTSSLNGGESFDVAVSGEGFYRFIKQMFPSNAGVDKRILRSIDVLTIAGNDDLNTYMKVNEPSTGLVQEKPTFTNLSNAIGIFAARYSKYLYSKRITKNSMNELCTGSITGNLLFCSDSTVYSAENFYCN
jgi:hypothetical protein